MAQKWIVNNDQLKMSGSVEYHKELATDHTTTKGGGFWAANRLKKILYLWGVSSDFGYTEPETIKETLEKDFMTAARYDGYTVMKSPIISVHIPSMESFEPICVLKA